MPIAHLLFVVTLVLSSPQSCSTWQECREQALAAVERRDYEAFHDLAWRAVQRGPKNDPALMLMLARAQSLSGRPGDALVMLQRLAAMGAATDAATSDDFRRVRALPGWADLEKRAAASPPEPSPPKDPEPTTTTSAVVAKTPAAAAPAPPRAGAEPALAARFSAPGLTPDALAYDRVSRRFLVADRDARKLLVVDEYSHNVATLAGAQAAFGDIEAIEIDARAGDLWVVSSEPLAAGGSSRLHKLQLISGRVLTSIGPPSQLLPARFGDVAITSAGPLVLDTTGLRVLKPRGASMDVIARVPAGATSVAAGENGTLYVSAAAGIWRVDGTAMTMMAAPGGITLENVTRVRYHRGALIALQRGGSGTRLLRLRLDRAGRAIGNVEVIDTLEQSAGAFTISGDALTYYAGGSGGDAVLRTFKLPEKRP